MAWYTKPILEPRIIGSRKGITFQKNFSKFVIRKRSIPVDKATPLQFSIRNKFENVQGSWRSLSPVQKTTWLTEAPNYQRVNSIGNNYTLTDLNLHCSSNRNFQGANQAAINSIPSSPSAAAPVLGSFVFDPVLFIFQIILSPNVIPANRTLFYYITNFSLTERPINFRNKFQLFAVNNAGFNTTSNIWSQFIASILIEQPSGITHYRNVSIFYMDNLTGQISPGTTFTLNYTF